MQSNNNQAPCLDRYCCVMKDRTIGMLLPKNTSTDWLQSSLSHERCPMTLIGQSQTSKEQPDITSGSHRRLRPTGPSVAGPEKRYTYKPISTDASHFGVKAMLSNACCCYLYYSSIHTPDSLITTLSHNAKKKVSYKCDCSWRGR